MAVIPEGGTYLSPAVRAIVWAQWRSLRNRLPRAGKSGLVLATLIAVLWYGLFALLALACAAYIAHAPSGSALEPVLIAGFLMAFLYWQVMPVMMASAGASLEIRKLLSYPVPESAFFSLDVLLRITAVPELLLLACGAAAGLILNPHMAVWTIAPLLAYVVFNLLLATGVREWLLRVMARRRGRELAALLFVFIAAAPQVLLRRVEDEQVHRWLTRFATGFWPWTSAGELAAGKRSAQAAVLLLCWTALAYFFARAQFRRTIRVDADESGASTVRRGTRPWTDALFTWPAALFRDPLAAVLEKELRTQARSPRFRLVFIMGFSFGLIIWFPVAFGRDASSDSVLSEHYLTFVSVYSLLLLGEVLFWNVFGFDRAASQNWFLAPVKLSSVLKAKNLSALVLVTVEITLILLICGMLRLPLGADRIAEAYSATLVLAGYLIATGNLTSVYQPRGINPGKPFRSSAGGRIQLMMFVVYPVAAIPVLLAFGARYAFDSEAAFYGALAVVALAGVVFYAAALDTAVTTAERRAEDIVARLSATEGPIAS